MTNVVAWIMLGLIAGFLASVMVNKRGRAGEGPLVDIVIGILGAMVGGWVFRTFGSVGVTGFDFWSLLVAFVGAVMVLVAWHAIPARGDTLHT